MDKERNVNGANSNLDFQGSHQLPHEKKGNDKGEIGNSN